MKATVTARPLHACMVAYTFYENDGRVMRYANALVEAGATVDAIVLRRPGQVAQENIGGVNVIRVQEREKNERGKFSYLWRVLSFLVRSALAVRRQHKARKYDLLHVHSVPDFEVFAALPAKVGGAKVILDIHDIVPEFYAAKFGQSSDGMMFRMLVGMERASAAFAHHVIIANDLWRRRLVERSVPEAKCTSFINFPDTNIFKASLRKRQPDGRFLIVYPGSLNHHQGLDIALRAVKIARAQIPNLTFEIYGEGPERERLGSMITELQLQDTVQLHGARPLREIAEIMSNADLGVVPKRNDSFGGDAFSTKILEFMAVGVPLVIADTRVDRHYFNDGLLRFFQAEDAEALAREIVAVHGDSSGTRARAAAGLHFVEENSWNRKKVGYLDLVARLTSERA